MYAQFLILKSKNIKYQCDQPEKLCSFTQCGYQQFSRPQFDGIFLPRSVSNFSGLQKGTGSFVALRPQLHIYLKNK